MKGAKREYGRKWNRKCRGGGGRRLVSFPLSPIPFPSLIPPLIPHLFSCSLSFPLCIFLPMIPYTWLPLTFSLNYSIVLSASLLFCSQVASQHYKTLPVYIFPLWSVPVFCNSWALSSHCNTFLKNLFQFSNIQAKHENIWQCCFLSLWKAVRVITGRLLRELTRAESDSPHDTQQVLTLSQSVPLDVWHASFHLSPILISNQASLPINLIAMTTFCTAPPPSTPTTTTNHPYKQKQNKNQKQKLYFDSTGLMRRSPVRGQRLD